MLPTSAWCRLYQQMWPICPDMLPTSAWCRPHQQMWPICPDMQPTSALYRPYICRYGRSSGRLVPRFCRRRPGVGHIGKYGRFAPMLPTSAISANMADLPRYAADVGHIGKYGRFVPICCRRRPDVGHIGRYGRSVPILCRRRTDM